jgi:hypothetical protein
MNEMNLIAFRAQKLLQAFHVQTSADGFESV